MADVVTFSWQIFTQKLITKNFYLFKQIDFLKNLKKFIVIAPSIAQK